MKLLSLILIFFPFSAFTSFDDLLTGECSLQDGFFNCDKSHIEFSGHEETQESEGKRILILDMKMSPPSAELINQGKILKSYQADPYIYSQNIIDSFRIDYEIPNKLLNFIDMLVDLPIEEKREIISKNDLPLFMLHTKIKVDPTTVDHGNSIFNLLVHHNPESQFVLGQFPEPNLKYICNIEKYQHEISKYYSRAADQYSQIIQQYGINYVNISYAWHTRRKAKQLFQYCSKYVEFEGVEEFLKARTQFVKKMAISNPDVTFVKAMPNDFYNFPSKLDEELNCNFPKNVFKIAYVSSLRTDIPKEGLSDFFHTDSQKFNKVCADLYINSGINQGLAKRSNPKTYWKNLKIGERWWRKNSLFEVRYGFATYPAKIMSTSYATPIALSYIHYLKQKNHFTNTQLKNYFDSKLFDPLFYEETFKGSK